MPQSLARLLVHLIFSTKIGSRFCNPRSSDPEVHAYLTATLQGQDCEAVQVGGATDYVHLLFGLSRIISVGRLATVFFR
jgi:putative transposase